MSNERAKFLRAAACAYSGSCSPLSSHLGSRLVEHSTTTAFEKGICPRCSVALTPDTSTTRTLTSTQLRHWRRRGHIRATPTTVVIHNRSTGAIPGDKTGRKYLVSHCKLCQCSAVTQVDTHIGKPHLLTATPSNPSSTFSFQQQRKSPSSHHTPKGGYQIATPSSLVSGLLTTPTNDVHHCHPSKTPFSAGIGKGSSTSPLTSACHSQFVPGYTHLTKKAMHGPQLVTRESKRQRKNKKRLSLKDALELTDSLARDRTSNHTLPPGLATFLS